MPQKVQLVLIGGGIANILLTLLLGLILTRSIVTRLNVMNDNSFRLASNKPLNNRVSGNDEISRLDNVFHEMAQSLLDAERKEKAILDNASDCICSLNVNLKFVSGNPACEDFFERNADDIISTRLFDYLSVKDIEQARVFLEQVKRGENPKAITVSLQGAAGKSKDVLWSAQWAAGEGKAGEWICIFHDITERRAAELLKQEVMAMVTHDLRTPLMTMQNFLELLSDGTFGETGELATRFLPGAQRSGERMLRLIGDLLDVEKINSGMMEIHPATVLLQQMFNDTAEQLSVFAREMEVTLIVEPTTAAVEADLDMLNRILVNILSNSIKFSPKGGTLSLSASTPETGRVIVKIVDQGPGIAPEMIESIFDRFQQASNQTERTKGGSGLGLAICKALVSLHGGKIWVESKLGEGSQFYFDLPAALDFKENLAAVKTWK